MDTEAIRQARIDLTAILRWADRLGLSEGICNHIQPGRPRHDGPLSDQPSGPPLV